MFAQDYCGLPSIVNLQGCSLLCSGCSLYSSGVHKGPLRAISPRAGGCHHLRPPCWGPHRRRGEAALDCARSRGGGDPGSRCPVQAGAGEGTAVLGALPGLGPRSSGRQRAARSGLPGRARVRTAGVGVEGVVVARVASGFPPRRSRTRLAPGGAWVAQLSETSLRLSGLRRQDGDTHGNRKLAASRRGSRRGFPDLRRPRSLGRN